MKKAISFCCIILLSSLSFYGENVSAHESTEALSKYKDLAGKATVSSYFIAGGEVLLSNTVLWAFNRYISHRPYSYINGDTILENLKSAWVWDQDEFHVNQIGHPYQGSFYYAAARGNGFNFWQSGIFTALGSISWEYFMENETPSINDLIVTTIGGMAMGEIFHRLYSEIKAAGGWYAFIVSPMEAFNSLVFRRHNNEPAGNIKELSFRLTFNSGFIARDFRPKLSYKPSTAPNQWNFINFGGDMLVVYGEPYGLESFTPFDHFDLRIISEVSVQYFNFSFFTDAFLFSFAPPRDAHIQDSVGMGIHLDTVWTNHINYAAHALGFTAKEQVLPGNDWKLRWALHLNWVFLDASDFWYFTTAEYPNNTGRERRWYNFGTGFGLKTSFQAVHPGAGTMTFDWKLYATYSFQSMTANTAPSGYTVFNIVTLEYRHKLGKFHSGGVAATLMHRYSGYNGSRFSDISMFNFNCNLFIAFDIY